MMYDRNLDRAHQDGRELLLLVPTGEEAAPLTQEVGWWDEELGRWEGDWRYYDGPGGYADREPIAWANLPPIDKWFFAKVNADAKRKAKLAMPAPQPKAVANVVPQLPKPNPKAADPRPAKGKRGVDMTTGKPIAAAKPTPIVSNTVPDDQFDGP